MMTHKYKLYIQPVKVFWLILFFALITTPLRAQSEAPPVQWMKCLGWQYDDFAMRTIRTSNNKYLIAGLRDNVGKGPNIVLYELDQAGVLIREKKFGGSLGETISSIIQTKSGDYVFIATITSKDGDIAGSQFHDGSNNTPDIWFVILDSALNIKRQRCLGGTKAELASSVVQTLDGGYILAGSTGSDDGDVFGALGGNDFWIVKLDTIGKIEWQKCLGGSEGDVATSIIQTSDSNYIVSGYIESNDGNVIGFHGDPRFTKDIWVVKLSTTGSLLWQRCLGGSSYDKSYSLVNCGDGDIVVSGITSSNDGDVSGRHDIGFSDIWVVKLNTDGDILWQKCYGGSNTDEVQSIVKTEDGGFVMAGYSSSVNGDLSSKQDSLYLDFWILKISNDGKIEWQKSLGGTRDDLAYSIIETPDGGFAITGYTRSNDGDVVREVGMALDAEIWIVKLGPLLETELGDINTLQQLATLYPNPTNNYFTLIPSSKKISGRVSVRIFDQRGIVVASHNVDMSLEHKINVSSLTSGVYQVYCDDVKVGSLIVQR